jgi:exosome complex RNA-binding protein Csl4
MTFVTPGDVIGTIEEGAAGMGTYEDRDNVVANTAGIVERRNGKFTVKMKKRVVNLKRGFIVYGIVKQITLDRVVVELLNVKRGDIRNVTPQYALLHISNIASVFVKRIEDFLKVGDIIKAKVIATVPVLSLTIKEPNLGVVMPYCSQCHIPMKKMGNVAFCPYCKKREHRKMVKENFNYTVI